MKRCMLCGKLYPDERPNRICEQCEKRAGEVKCTHRWNKRIKVEKDGTTYKCMVCREVYKLPGKVTA